MLRESKKYAYIRTSSYYVRTPKQGSGDDNPFKVAKSYRKHIKLLVTNILYNIYIYIYTFKAQKF